MPPIIDLTDIDYTREGNCILRGVSWCIHAGQHWALLGANGSGKTSLLKVVTGYEWPTEGEVHVLGRRFGECDLRELRRHVGWVSSSLEHQFPPHNRALDVVLSGFDASIGTYREMTAAEHDIARAALAHLGIASLAERPYRLCSQGDQQRVLIARALVNHPSLLILDEPCSGLDPAARESFLEDLSMLVTPKQHTASPAPKPPAPAPTRATTAPRASGSPTDSVLVEPRERVNSLTTTSPKDPPSPQAKERVNLLTPRPLLPNDFPSLQPEERVNVLTPTPDPLSHPAYAATPPAPTIIYVTHHVEELRPWISHTLLLRQGRALAQGPTRDVLTSANLSATFNMPLALDTLAGRYYLRPQA
ncbi:MAG: ATP-binding cassette domain-containing protein [Gemmataceae bacterium]|nr:ATP-binding cassette domain-containing protein [Gemmataceae bacterium]